MSCKNWKNTPTLAALKEEVTGADYSNGVKNSRIVAYREAYREITKMNVPEKGSKKTKSNHRSRLIEDEVLSASSELQYHITNPNRLFNVVSTNSEAGAKEHSLLLHKQFDALKSDLADESSIAFTTDGTLCLKTGWKFVEETHKSVTPIMAESLEEAELFIESINSKNKQKKLRTMLEEKGNIPVSFDVSITKTVSENVPTVTTINPLTLLVDPKAKRPSDIRFVVEIHETDYISLVNSKGKFQNLKKLKEYIKNTSSMDMHVTVDDYDHRIDEDGMFEFSDLARKKFTVHEYWGYYDINGNNTLEPIVAMWVGDILIRLEASPYPFKELPYDFTSYYPVYGSIWGTCIPDRLYDEQKAKTGTIRAIQDITDIQASDQEFVDTSIFVNDLQISNYQSGKTVYLKKGADPDRGIYKRNITPISGGLFDQLGMYENNAVNKTGNFSTDQIQYAGSSAGNNEAIDGITFKKKAVIRRYLNIFEAVGRKITKMNSAYILEGDTRYSDEAPVHASKKRNLSKVDIGLLQEEVAVNIEVLTSHDADAKAAKIIALMDTSVGSMSEETASLHFKKIAEYWDMHDLVAGIDAEMKARAESQPSEEELEMQRIELERLRLENEKTKLDILLKTKEMENTDTIMLERLNRLEIGLEEANKFRIAAEGKLSEATAGKYNAQTELFNQSFDLVESGTKREQEKQDAEYQHQANLEREQIRTERELELMSKKYDNSKNNSSKGSEPVDPMIEYIREGTLNNDSYDAMGHVYRNILNQSPEYTNVKEKTNGIVRDAKREAKPQDEVDSK